MGTISYEEYLEKYGELTYTNVGVSMMPMIKQGRDSFTVRKLKAGEVCKPWDVVLYTRPPKAYVLHRIIAVHEGNYDILGDNCIAVEKNIPAERILAVMTEFTHKGKRYTDKDWQYRLYVNLICKPYKLRIFIKKCMMVIWHIIKPIVRGQKAEGK